MVCSWASREPQRRSADWKGAFAMSVKLFVGGLSFSTTSEGMREAFARFGPVNSATVMTDRETGRSRGFGFVEMASAEEADKAISALNGSSLDGRMIRVDKATPRGAGAPGPRRPFGGPGGPPSGGFRPGGPPSGGFRSGGPGGGGGGGFGGPRPGGFGDRRPSSGFPPADPGRGGFGDAPGGPRNRRAAPGDGRRGDQRPQQRPGTRQGPKRKGGRKFGDDTGGGRGRRTSDGDFRWGR